MILEGPEPKVNIRATGLQIYSFRDWRQYYSVNRIMQFSVSTVLVLGLSVTNVSFCYFHVEYVLGWPFRSKPTKYIFFAEATTDKHPWFLKLIYPVFIWKRVQLRRLYRQQSPRMFVDIFQWRAYISFLGYEWAQTLRMHIVHVRNMMHQETSTSCKAGA